MADGRLDFRVEPGGSLQGTARVPGDKSISHRAVLLGGIAVGDTAIDGFLAGEDTLASLAALGAMGIRCERDGERVLIRGRGRSGLQAPTSPLNLGNSGTGMRLMAGLLAGQRFDSVLVGDPSLSSRPMRRIIDPLRRMGAKIAAGPRGTAPLEIAGAAERLVGIDYVLPVASAQVKSCILLAGLFARGRTRVVEPAPTRDHTERMLRAFGYPLQQEGRAVVLEGGHRLVATGLVVPADLSSAAFFLVGASIAAGSELVLEGVGLNPTRDGVLRILRRMGARITVLNAREAGAEPVGDLQVSAAPLHGIEIEPDLVPLAIDEFPAILVAAAAARGTTVLRGAEELRVKETDRIAAMAEGLAALGVRAEPTADGMIVHGQGRLRGGRVRSHGDHRIAMAFAMAGLAASGAVEIEDCAPVATSFPGFSTLAARLGLRISAESPGG